MIKSITFKHFKVPNFLEISKRFNYSDPLVMILNTLFLQINARLVAAPAVGHGAAIITKIFRARVANDEGALKLESLRSC